MSETPAKPPGGPGSLFLFDAYNFVFRAYHALPMLNAPDGTPVNAVHGFVRMVQAVRRDYAPQAVAAVFEGGDGGRREKYPEYKANRPPPPEDLTPQFPLVRDAVDALGIPRVEATGYEADDAIASYALAAQAAGLRVIVVSSDKDLMQLCHDGADGKPPIYLFDTMKDRLVGPPEVVEKFGVGPELLGDLLALTGDSSDNVPGVPGIGPKTAATLLGEYGSLEAVLEAAPTIKQKKRRERLIEHADDARVSRELVALRTEIELPKPLEQLDDSPPDEAKLAEFFEPIGFKMVLRELGTAPRGRGRGRGRRAPQPGQGEQQGAQELLPVAGYEAAGDAHRLMLAADEQAWGDYVAALPKADAIAVHVALEGDDSLEAEIVGIGLAALGDKLDETLRQPVYVPIGHRQGELMDGRPLAADAVLEALRPIFEGDSPPLWLHDAKRQALILRRSQIELRGVAVDTMLASYVLDPARSAHTLASLGKDVLGHTLRPADKVLGKGRKAVRLSELGMAPAANWQCEHVDLVRALGRALGDQLAEAGDALVKLYREVEQPLAQVLVAVERRGIGLDASVLQGQSDELSTQIKEVVGRVEQEAGYSLNLDSPIQLRKLLFEERGLPPGRKTKTGYSTDARVLEELSQLDPIVKDILVYRSLTKLKNTYLDALPTLVNERTGRLHTSFHQAVAATGRLSSSDPNLQNIPIRTEEGRRIREAFVAAPQTRLVALDYSQIELRVLAHLSGDPNLRSAFVDDVDVHRRTAAEVFELAEEEVTDEQRRIAKAVNFGVIYGQTAFGLAQQLGIPRGKAGSYIRAYFEKIPGVEQYMKELVARAKARGYAETILGRKRRIPELGRKGAARQHGERMARNTPIQGSAAEILKLSMIAVERALADVPWAQMLLTVHDELIFECAQDKVDALIELATPLMEGAFSLDVPLKVEAGHGRTWAECKG